MNKETKKQLGIKIANADHEDVEIILNWIDQRFIEKKEVLKDVIKMGKSIKKGLDLLK